MKDLIIFICVLLFIGLFSAGAIYVAGKDYATVGCIASGDCLLPAATPLWAVATGIGIITLLCAGIVIIIWDYRRKH